MFRSISMTGMGIRECAAAAATAAKSLQSCPTLCNPIDGSPPGSPVPGILQARTQEWIAISFSHAWKWKVKVKLLSHVRLSDPMDCSPPGSSIHGIFQTRVLEWGAIAFSNHGAREQAITIWWQLCELGAVSWLWYSQAMSLSSLSLWIVELMVKKLIFCFPNLPQIRLFHLFH